MELYVWIWLQAIWMTFVNWYVLKSSYNIPPSSIPYLIFFYLQTLDNMINTNVLTFDKKPFVKEAILKKHRHQYEGEKHKDHSHHSNMSKLPLIRSLAEIGRSHSSSKSEWFTYFGNCIFTFYKCLTKISPTLEESAKVLSKILYKLIVGLSKSFDDSFKSKEPLSCTVWKNENFSAIQILRESNCCKFPQKTVFSTPIQSVW